MTTSGMSDAIAVHVASYNTRSVTELCIRTIHRHAGHPFELIVGDSGSSDGSVELLTRLEAAGWLELQRSPRQWHHSDWLDHWLATTPAARAVFCDSDVEFLRPNWLAELVAEADRAGAALVTGEMVPEHRDMIEPVGGKRVRARPRPAPWLMLVDVPVLRSLATSFAFHALDPADVPEGIEIFDVGGWLYRRMAEEGMTAQVMPTEYRRSYRHYGGRSWGRARGLGRLRAAQASARIAIGLRSARRAQPRPSPDWRPRSPARTG